jgi:hypothetical protein
MKYRPAKISIPPRKKGNGFIATNYPREADVDHLLETEVGTIAQRLENYEDAKANRSLPAHNSKTSKIIPIAKKY